MPIITKTVTVDVEVEVDIDDREAFEDLTQERQFQLTKQAVKEFVSLNRDQKDEILRSFTYEQAAEFFLVMQYEYERYLRGRHFKYHFCGEPRPDGKLY
jgi:hypothetical protein